MRDTNVWFAPAGSEQWTELGTAEADGLVYEYEPVARVDDGRQVRAWARIGPDGALALDAPLVEVDPETLIRAIEASFD